MTIIMLIIVYVFIFLWLLLAFYIARSFFGTTPFYPSKREDLESHWESFGISIKPKKTKFLDVGSGDGRIVFWAAEQGMVADGIDNNPYLTLLSRIRRFFIRVIRRKKLDATFIHTDFYNYSFASYDIVYFYIFKEHMHALEDRIFNEMKPGSVIISNVFTFKHHEPEKHIGRFRVYRVSK